MKNFAEDLRESVRGEILGVVIGEMGLYGHNEEGKPDFRPYIGKLLTWDEAKPILDYEYDDGFGAPDCQAVYIWTDEEIVFVSQYDGSTTINTIPRNPKAWIPEMPGS